MLNQVHVLVVSFFRFDLNRLLNNKNAAYTKAITLLITPKYLLSPKKTNTRYRLH